MKNILFTLLILLSIYGCQRKSYCERKAQKFARLIKDCPQLIDTTTTIDTVFIRDTVTFSVPSKVDSNEFDSLLQAYCNEARLQVPSGSSSNNSVIAKTIIRNKLYYKYGIGNQTLIYKGDTITLGYNENEKGLNLSILSVKKLTNTTQYLKVPCFEPWHFNWVTIAIITSIFWIITILCIKNF